MDSFLDTVPIKFWEFYRKKWSTIRQRTTKGKLKDIYHFPLSPTDRIFGKLDKALENYQNDIKLNVALIQLWYDKQTYWRSKILSPF